MNQQIKPLSGMKVLDLGRALAGPVVGVQLADFGAEVIKIESSPDRNTLKTGDWTRAYSVAYASANRCKKSVSVYLNCPEGRQIMLDLAKNADIIIENFKDGAMSKLGLSYEDFKQVNPRIIMCSLSGYAGLTSRGSEARMEHLIQMESGLLHLSGSEGEPIQRIGIYLNDITSGLQGAIAVLNAVIHRERTGEGAYVKVGMYQSALYLALPQVTMIDFTKKAPPRVGMGDPMIFPCNQYACRDGNIYLIIATPDQWTKFCNHLLERPDLAAGNMRDLSHRCKHKDEINKMIQDYFATKTLEEVKQLGKKYTIAMAEISDFEQSFAFLKEELPQLLVKTQIGEDVVNTMLSPALTPTEVVEEQFVSNVGEHTQEVLTSVGYDQDMLENLSKQGIIYQGSNTHIRKKAA